MTQLQLLLLIGTWLINITFAASALFPVVTALFWPWWESWWGRNIAGLEVCIAATLLPSVLFRDFGINAIGLRWVQVVSLAMVAVFIVWRTVMIWLTQRQGLDWAASPSRAHSEGPHLRVRPLFPRLRC